MNYKIFNKQYVAIDTELNNVGLNDLDIICIAEKRNHARIFNANISNENLLARQEELKKVKDKIEILLKEKKISNNDLVEILVGSSLSIIETVEKLFSTIDKLNKFKLILSKYHRSKREGELSLVKMMSIFSCNLNKRKSEEEMDTISCINVENFLKVAHENRNIDVVRQYILTFIPEEKVNHEYDNSFFFQEGRFCSNSDYYTIDIHSIQNYYIDKATPIIKKHYEKKIDLGMCNYIIRHICKKKKFSDYDQIEKVVKDVFDKQEKFKMLYEKHHIPPKDTFNVLKKSSSSVAETIDIILDNIESIKKIKNILSITYVEKEEALFETFSIVFENNENTWDMKQGVDMLKKIANDKVLLKSLRKSLTLEEIKQKVREYISSYNKPSYVSSATCFTSLDTKQQLALVNESIDDDIGTDFDFDNPSVINNSTTLNDEQQFLDLTQSANDDEVKLTNPKLLYDDYNEHNEPPLIKDVYMTLGINNLVAQQPMSSTSYYVPYNYTNLDKQQQFVSTDLFSDDFYKQSLSEQKQTAVNPVLSGWFGKRKYISSKNNYSAQELAKKMRATNSKELNF